VTVTELGDLFFKNFRWIALVMSAGMFYICLRRFQVKRKTTVEFWQTLVLGLWILSQGILGSFGFFPSTPKVVKAVVDVVLLLCMVALLFPYLDRLRQHTPP